ncbi:MAG: dethiobiotin synthase [Verrucomicrobia bacterium]|nr:dethiobiotin synthase [Verrucomicrobiota bacterium]
MKVEGRKPKAEGRPKVEIRKGACVFVAGTDTGVGKTFVSAEVVRALRRAGVHAGAVKPFATGNRDDARVLQAAMDGELTLKEINPVFFRRPLAPMVAARLEKKRVALRVKLPVKRFDLLLVEGVGGWLVPLTERVTVADWVARQGWPIIIVARAGLGTINHTLLTVESARRRGVKIAGVILNDVNKAGAATARRNAAVLRRLTRLPVFLSVEKLAGKVAASLRDASQ